MIVGFFKHLYFPR